MNQHPDCTRDASECRLLMTHSIQQPMIAWQPVYDLQGRRTNHDPNTFLTEITCDTCHMSWTVRRRDGEDDDVGPQQPIELPEGSQS